MRTFTKSTKLEHVLYDVRGPVVDEANRMEENGMRVLKLNIGNPAPFGFQAPEEVIQDIRDNIVNCQGYSDSRGIFAARKAIMQYAQLKHIPNVQMKDIFTGNGASELIQLSLNALLNPGDEVLIPSPDYPLWTACTNLAGGKAVHYICDEESDWYPDPADIESKITSKTKAIVIINPNNPTGALYPRELLEFTLGLTFLAGFRITFSAASFINSRRYSVQVRSPLASTQRSHLQSVKKKSSRITSSKRLAESSMISCANARSLGSV